ncbi:DUF2948 family protein [Roseisalinus antarcticus]|uniref:DUF2948 domain-containing protein n=1 Tax=Roseisalinus antarcticus TaxID=254357 RepID=A0A1Y5SA99_9RHOB|nr:DUF2948 family protein [Roseisalinus antarcticus]SLN35367.1 hypothetical protein ROA7023_01281 [Roseisalinus antarcticus]
MTEDARFEDGGEAPLRLRALDADDLAVISSLCQDAVFPGSEIAWDRKHRRFALLLNRFRWEDAPKAQALRRDVERVQAVLSVEDVGRVQSQGVRRGESDTVLSLLAVTFEPGEDGGGAILLTLAGDGAIRLEVEALEVLLRDVTRPYRAPSGKVPGHDD